MTISRITRLKGCGIFRDYTWPNNLLDFKRFNLIYGWNGSGKTTLSRLFRALELRKVPDLGQATMRVDGSDLSGVQFPTATTQLRVFNRDLVSESIFATGSAEVPPIFVVGRESAEKQREVDKLKRTRDTSIAEFESARAGSQVAERAFDHYCQERARAIKDTLRSPGSSAFNNYNKSDYKAAAVALAKEGDAQSHRLSETDREALLLQYRATPKQKLPGIEYRLPDLRSLGVEVSSLLEKTVVSAAIQSLREDSVVGEWVRRGLALHKSRQTETCLFCEQALPASRLPSLEAHFSAEYERFVEEVDNCIERLTNLSARDGRLQLPAAAEVYDDLAADLKAAELSLREALDSVHSYIGVLVSVLREKRTKVFDRLSIGQSPPRFDADPIAEINEVIARHNLATDEFQSRAKVAGDRICNSMIAEDVERFVSLQQEVETASAEAGRAATESESISSDIAELERQIIEHRGPAEDLNADLKAYLGHSELRFAVKDTGYSITRNGEPATSLSEGETTAIALLYFLKSLEDRRFDLGSGVVVLDDPVSSLDQNALFAAFAYMRERTRSAQQIIVLTHNFLFFRQVREWFGNLRGPDKRDWNIFMLEASATQEGRSSQLKAIDALLVDFDSEYHYLFSKLYQMATDPPAGTLEKYYGAPSMARRLIESFLAFRVPDLVGRNRLWSQMQAIDFEEAKRSRIYRFIQTHSHRDAVGAADEDMTILAESKAVLNDVLEFMRAADEDHVARMIAKVTQADGSDEE